MESLVFKTKEEENDFYKTRVESLGLSIRTENILKQASIRTIGGVVKKTESMLLNIDNLEIKNLEEIKKKLQEVYNVFRTGNKTKHLEPAARDYEERHNDNDDHTGFKNSFLLESKPTFFLNIPFLNKSVEEKKDTIVDLFASHFGLTKEDLISKSRKKENVFARDMLTYSLRKYTGVPFSVIGNLLGGRDHTTIIYSYKKTENYILENNYLEDELKELVNQYRNTKTKN